MVLAALGAGLIGAGPHASTAVAARSCPSFIVKGSDFRYRVAPTIDKGGTACSTARSLLRDLYLGRGTTIGQPPNLLRLIRGWSCGTGAGGAVCWRPRGALQKARHRISAEVRNAPAQNPRRRTCSGVVVRNPDGSVYARTAGRIAAVRTSCATARGVAYQVLNADDGAGPLPRPYGFTCRVRFSAGKLRAACAKSTKRVAWVYGRA